jgi:hypothetical protein
VADPQNPFLLGSIITPGLSRCVSVIDGIAYVADQTEGLQIINVANPATPESMGVIKPHTTSDVNRCYGQGNRLYVSDITWNEISIYDIGTPGAPVLIDRYSWNLKTYDMTVANGRLYTANGVYGVNIHGTPGTLSPPQNLSIVIQDHSIQLSWQEVAGATGYRVYSSENPTGDFTLDTSGNYQNLSWSTTTQSKRFYRVTALGE